MRYDGSSYGICIMGLVYDGSSINIVYDALCSVFYLQIHVLNFIFGDHYHHM